MDTIKVYAWPDTTWRYAEEYSEEIDKWKGEDYVVIDNFDPSMSYEDIEEYIIDMFGGV